MPWRIDSAAPLDTGLRERITARITAYDRSWSRFRADSLVAMIAQTPGSYLLPAEAAPLLAWYAELYAATAGRLSPLARAGTRAVSFADALAWDGERLDTVRPLTLDTAAAGKGQLVDLVAEFLDAAGVSAWVIDASGDLRLRGVAGFRVALEHPGDATQAVGVAELGDRALAASATVRRDGQAHIVDAVTGLPRAEVLASWAVAGDAMTADGAATALVLGVDEGLLTRRGVAHARLYADGRLERSSDFPGELFG